MSMFSLNHFQYPFLSPFLSQSPPPPPPPPPPHSVSIKPNFVRITFNCGGYNPKSIKTDLIGTKLFISGKEEARIDGENFSIKEFKRSYELPLNSDGSKLISYMAPTGQLLIEIPLKQMQNIEDLCDHSISSNSNNSNNNNNNSHRKVMGANLDESNNFTFKYQLPDNVDTSKLNVSLCNREIIINTIDSNNTSSFSNNSTLKRNHDHKKIRINYLK
jgi:HSP20 family molecular chaperone IbpA